MDFLKLRYYRLVRRQWGVLWNGLVSINTRVYKDIHLVGILK